MMEHKLDASVEHVLIKLRIYKRFIIEVKPIRP